MQRTSILLVGIGLAIASCGTGANTDGEPSLVDSLPDAAELIEEAEARGLSALEVALERSGQTQAYRVRTSQAQTVRLPVIGLDQTAELDRSVPAVVAEVDATGASSASIDFGAVFAPDAGLDVVLKIWLDDERLLLDLTDYEQLAQSDPALATSPFRPGLASVDVERAENSGVDDLVALVAGQPVPDPGRLAVELRDNLPNAEVVDGDPNRFRVTTTAAGFFEAVGQDVDIIARGIAGGLASSVGVSIDELADAYATVYREAPAEIVVSIDESGVDVLELTTDLSSVWVRLEEIIPDAPAGFSEGGVLEVVAFYDFDLDDSITIQLPDGDFEDRTDEMVELFAGS